MSSDQLREVGLVSCVKSKQDEPAVPKDLYTSAYFRKMRTYAETHHDDWWILSAKHGLLDPDGEPIEPYDDTLTEATKAERREWAGRVHTELANAGLLTPDTRLVLHAGRAYYNELMPLLTDSDVAEIQIPTEGMLIGERMSWYDEHS